MPSDPPCSLQPSPSFVFAFQIFSAWCVYIEKHAYFFWCLVDKEMLILCTLPFILFYFFCYCHFFFLLGISESAWVSEGVGGVVHGARGGHFCSTPSHPGSCRNTPTQKRQLVWTSLLLLEKQIGSNKGSISKKKMFSVGSACWSMYERHVSALFQSFFFFTELLFSYRLLFLQENKKKKERKGERDDTAVSLICLFTSWVISFFVCMSVCVDANYWCTTFISPFPVIQYTVSLFFFSVEV